MKYIGYAVLGLLAFAGLYVASFGMTFLNIHVGGFLKAEQQEVQTKVFENTTSYTRGMNSEFTQLYLSYEVNNNMAVCQTIKHKFGTYYDVLEPLQQQQYDTLVCVKEVTHE